MQLTQNSLLQTTSSVWIFFRVEVIAAALAWNSFLAFTNVKLHKKKQRNPKFTVAEFIAIHETL